MSFNLFFGKIVVPFVIRISIVALVKITKQNLYTNNFRYGIMCLVQIEARSSPP